MIISEDQNEILLNDGTKLIAVKITSDSECLSCYFTQKRIYCGGVLCDEKERRDKCNVFFKEA